MTPNDRKYTREHEWVIIENGRARLGITAHAQEALGDIVYVELPQVGDTVKAGDSAAVVESVKAVSNVYTPVGGEVLEVNQPLEDEPERLNSAPYEEFIVVLAASEVDEAALLSAAEYDAFVAAL
ncbi:MAG TPA: glycine cleavage system protein GcvH [Feifaniaceae bacterium]|nr:glycine cleavage system protein GcvH [Feifaniaceae bacterium]